ncbi:nucleotidyl transferase AbiEii/AbiGii toxin family protein [Streptomyces sp. NPDC060194]|uniref:nucleotidyl transferase AbiEii/AbiGii toxin family protein n=1 Tax=Streptomyces sp. NPDC060194 TaxID=3347069 RepID=UPI00364840EC
MTGVDGERGPTEDGYPRTMLRLPHPAAVQYAMFDPALKQFPNAYRAGDPAFPDGEATRAWQSARAEALAAVLDGVADSSWAQSLVLRGSALMALGFGADAREPGDLDFVVVPTDWELADARTDALFAGVAAAAEARSAVRDDGPRIDAAGAVVEDIWTYERVPGRRMMLPWTAPHTSGGWVQLDLVFGETLSEPPGAVCLPSGGRLLAASPALSLAWKILWLLVDAHAQGKDLYDAVLLAERHPLPYALLLDVLTLSEDWTPLHEDETLAERLHTELQYVEWHHFEDEYPRFHGRLPEFIHRLLTALAPTFAEEPRG